MTLARVCYFDEALFITSHAQRFIISRARAALHHFARAVATSTKRSSAQKTSRVARRLGRGGAAEKRPNLATNREYAAECDKRRTRALRHLSH